MSGAELEAQLAETQGDAGPSESDPVRDLQQHINQAREEKIRQKLQTR